MLAKFSGKFGYTVGLTLWVLLAFILGQVVAALLLAGLPLGLKPAIETTVLAALSYVFGIMIAIGVPPLVTKKPITKKTLGIDRLPSWSDIGLGILSMLPYYIASGMLLWIGVEVFKVIDPDVGQQIPFQNLTMRVEYIVAFLTLVVFAPIAEEVLFRGYFFGRLNERTGKWVAVLVTAVIFGLLHVLGFTETGLVLQWSAAADTFAMGLTAGILRLLSGSVWAGVILHMVKNAVAYYFLFIAPSLPGGGS